MAIGRCRCTDRDHQCQRCLLQHDDDLRHKTLSRVRSVRFLPPFSYPSVLRSSPLHGSIFTYNPFSTKFRFLSNFSFHIDDKDTDLYYFEPGPVASIGGNSSTIYMPVECGTSFQRLFLMSFDVEKKTYKQSKWILHDGDFAYLFYDPVRVRLLGLRTVSTFTLIVEEYDMQTLNITRKYTQQDGETYAFPYGACSVFDYEENWIVEVRTRFENPSVNAYYVKMDLNLVGKREDIVTDFHLMPDVHNLCTMTYDMKTKKIFATWQHGSIELDLIMLYMDPYTGAFTNETLLLKMEENHDIDGMQAIYDEKSRQILFVIQIENDLTLKDQCWLMIVEFDTMKIVAKKQVTNVHDFFDWELFLLPSS